MSEVKATTALNLTLDVWEMILNRVSGFTVLKVAFLAGNRRLSTIVLHACRELVFSSKPYLPQTPIQPLLINQFLNLRLLHIAYPTGAPFRSYEFLSNLPNTITDLSFHFPTAHNVWIVLPPKDEIQPVYVPEWFGGPVIIRMDKLLPRLQSLQLLGAFHEPGYAKSTHQNYAKLRTKFLSKMPKSLTRLCLGSKLIDELPRLPKHVTDVSFVLENTLVSTLYLTARRHSVESLTRFSRKPLQHLSLHLSCPIEMLPELPPSVTALECLPYTAHLNYYELNETTCLLFPPQLTSLSLIGRDTYWETVALLPRTLLHLSMNIRRWKNENTKRLQSATLFPPNLKSLALVSQFFYDIPPVPPSVTKVKYRVCQGSPSLKHFGNASSISTDSLPVVAPFPPHVTFLDLALSSHQLSGRLSVLPTSLTEIRFSMIKEVMLPILSHDLPSLTSVFFSSIMIDGSSIGRNETEFSAKTIENSIRRVLGSLIPDGALILLEPDCPAQLRFDNKIMGLKWDIMVPLHKLNLPASITLVDLPVFKTATEDITKACPNLQILKLPQLNWSSSQSIILPKIKSIELRTGFGQFFDAENLEEIPLEHLSFTNATIVHDRCLARLDSSYLRSISLGCLPLVSTSRFQLTHVEFTQFTEWHNVHLLPRTITKLSLIHPFPELSLIDELFIRSLPPKIEFLYIPYMPAVGWGLLNSPLSELQIHFASILDPSFFLKLDEPEFDSRASLEFHHSIPTLSGRWKVSNPRHKQGIVQAALLDSQIQENTRIKTLILPDHTLTPKCIPQLPRELQYLDFGCPTQISSDLPSGSLLELPNSLTALVLRSYILLYGDIEALPHTLQHLEARISQPKDHEVIVFPPKLQTLNIVSPVSLSAASPILPPSLKSLEWKSAPGSKIEITEYVDSVIPLLPNTLQSLTLELPCSAVRSLQAFPEHIIHMNCGPNLFRPVPRSDRTVRLLY